MKTIYRTNKNKENFTQVDNGLIKHLKPKELGLMIYFLSMPDYYKFSIEEIESITCDKTWAIKSGIKELENKGYLIKLKERDKIKQVNYVRYIIKENPDIEINVENKDINIYRITKIKNFTQLDKGFIFDDRLSLNAKGILFYMLSKPNYWQFYVTEIKKDLDVSRKLIWAGLDELEKYGYIKKKMVNKRKNQYIIFEKPNIIKLVKFSESWKSNTEKLEKEHLKVGKGTLKSRKSDTNNNLINNLINNSYQNKSKLVNFDLQENKINFNLSNNTSKDNYISELLNNNEQFIGENSIINNVEHKNSNNEEYSHYRDFEMGKEEENEDEYDERFDDVETVSTPIFSSRIESSLKDNKDNELLNNFENNNDTFEINKEVLTDCQKNNDIEQEKITSNNNEVNLDYEYDNTKEEDCQVDEDILPWETEEEYYERKKEEKEGNKQTEESAYDIIKKILESIS
ncbi:hypothetical protein [Thermoanaerobacterium thermosulfurigenes]|uniref:hypothetical protein n=1 Tax=Thermoanaerobacterium thermosulfurigenes TaxID=33950 RepID=UPI003EFAB56C